VNGEVGKLQKILARANLWHRLADDYQPLDTPFEQPRRVMTKKEEAHLFAVAASRSEFAFIYAYCLLSVNTSASGAELRGLRLMVLISFTWVNAVNYLLGDGPKIKRAKLVLNRIIVGVKNPLQVFRIEYLQWDFRNAPPHSAISSV
jgi:hypothetical protein